MYLVSILALFIMLVFMCIIQGLELTYLIDLPSILLILLITIPILMSTGLFRDFNNAFRLGMRKKEENVTLRELKRAVEAVSLAIRTILLSGVLVSVIQCVAILRNLDDPSFLGPMLSLAILVIVYAMGLALLLLPLRTRLKIKMIEYLADAGNDVENDIEKDAE